MTEGSDKKGGSSKLGRNVALAAVCLGLLIPILFVVWRVRLKEQVDSKIAALRKSGFPASGAEITSWRPLPKASENGAVALKQAIALLSPFEGKGHSTQLSKLLETNVWSPEVRLRIKGYLETNRMAVVNLKEALKFRRFAFVTDYSPGIGTLMPHLAKLKEAGLLLAATAGWEVEEAEEGVWVDDVQKILGLARTLDEEPILISWMVRAAVIRMAIREVERGLNTRVVSNEGCRALRESLAGTLTTNLLPGVLAGERALVLPVFAMSAAEIERLTGSSSDSEILEKVRFRVGWLFGLQERDQEFYMETYQGFISQAKEAPPESLKSTNLIDAAASTALGKGFALSGMMLPAMSSVFVKDAGLRASVAIATVALAIEEFRNVHKKAPERLEELAPKILKEIPIDPFDGKMIRYRRMEKGYVVYSVDADGFDESGVERPTGKGAAKGTFDLVFRVDR
jgi:hypothetical protein